MVKPKVLFNNHELFSRVNYLYQAAHTVLRENPSNIPLIRHYCFTLRTIARKNVLRLDPSIKRSLCRKCCMLLVPGITALVRVRGEKQSHQVQTCMECGTVKRFVVSSSHSIWTDHPEAWSQPPPKYLRLGNDEEDEDDKDVLKEQNNDKQAPSTSNKQILSTSNKQAPSTSSKDKDKPGTSENSKRNKHKQGGNEQHKGEDKDEPNEQNDDKQTAKRDKPEANDSNSKNGTSNNHHKIGAADQHNNKGAATNEKQNEATTSDINKQGIATNNSKKGTDNKPTKEEQNEGTSDINKQKNGTNHCKKGATANYTERKDNCIDYMMKNGYWTKPNQLTEVHSGNNDNSNNHNNYQNPNLKRKHDGVYAAKQDTSILYRELLKKLPDQTQSNWKRSRVDDIKNSANESVDRYQIGPCVSYASASVYGPSVSYASASASASVSTSLSCVTVCQATASETPTNSNNEKDNGRHCETSQDQMNSDLSSASGSSKASTVQAEHADNANANNSLSDNMCSQMTQFLSRVENDDFTSKTEKCSYCSLREMQIRVPKKGFKTKNSKKGVGYGCKCQNNAANIKPDAVNGAVATVTQDAVNGAGPTITVQNLAFMLNVKKE